MKKNNTKSDYLITKQVQSVSQYDENLVCQEMNVKSFD